MLTYDRDTASRFGITAQLLDNTLYDAFGQRPVSVMYTALNQYQVIMEAAPQYWENPAALRDIYVLSPTGAEVPLSALSHYVSTTASLTINHQGQFPCVTLSFNLAPGKALSDAVSAINEAQQAIGMPATVRGGFQGTALTYQASLANEPILIVGALAAVYIVLGILYESFIHPITILTTLPSAAVGAGLALKITNTELSYIALIGIILLIGIVKKNAIMMIDFALSAERNEGKSPRDAIFEACQLRFRPIMMTTMAAMFGALPLALDTGTGSELRRPLGIVIIGGLIMSQALTLYTTPVVYLYWERLSLWWRGSGEANREENSTGRISRGAGSLNMKTIIARITSAALIPSALFLTACMVGPDYKQPTAPTPAAYKEVGDWKQAQPSDDVIRGKWWEIYHDTQLNALEDQVNISNQNVIQAEAQFREAAAAVKVARAALFPTITANPAFTESQASQNPLRGRKSFQFQRRPRGKLRRKQPACRSHDGESL